MIRNLRRRFIGITMLSVILVLTLLIGGINLANYRSINKNLDLRLDLLEENGGSLDAERRAQRPEEQHSGEQPQGQPGENPPNDRLMPQEAHGPEGEPPKREAGFGGHFSFFPRSLSAESFFDTRYFTVSIGSDGQVTDIDDANIATMPEEAAKALALSLYEKKASSGYFGEYKYRAISKTAEDGAPYTMYLFLNAARELETYRFFLFASILISVVGSLLILLLVVILSKIAVRPIAESYEKQKRFITDASHEIKTPLAIIEANTEVVEMENGESEWTKSIRNQIRRLSSLTQKLVFLSRMDEESTKLTVTEFDLSDAVLETAEGFSGSALSSGRTLTLSIAPSLTYKGDKAMLSQLVSLLLDNAMKYASEGSEVRLTLEPFHKGKRTIRLVEENAVDEIEKGDLDILFERFYRSDPSRSSSTGGHGIGLSVAAAIVRAHNGSIHAKSEDGHSIRFTVHL